MQLPPNVELYDDEYSLSRAQRYVIQERLGEGTFGEVRKAVDSRSGAEVAIKSVRILSRKSGIPKAVFREMQALKQLSNCEFILKLFDVYPDESNLCLVTEYVASDLSEVINQAKDYLSRANLKCFFRMIFEGIGFCHSKGIIHRDIKPANLLLSSSGIVKLGDFGLARIYEAREGGASMSHQVATRQYRAPELLYASRHYTLAVDIWSVAVVMAELISLQPLFPGNNDIDQMFRVFQIMGSPTPEVWPGVQNLPDYSKVNFPNMQPLPLSVVLPQAHPEDLAFLQHFLVLDPQRRVSAQDALRLDYFSTNPLPSPSSDLQVPRRVKSDLASIKSGNASNNLLVAGKPVGTVDEFLGVVDNIVCSDIS